MQNWSFLSGLCINKTEISVIDLFILINLLFSSFINSFFKTKSFFLNILYKGLYEISISFLLIFFNLISWLILDLFNKDNLLLSVFVKRLR